MRINQSFNFFFYKPACPQKYFQGRVLFIRGFSLQTWREKHPGNKVATWLLERIKFMYQLNNSIQLFPSVKYHHSLLDDVTIWIVFTWRHQIPKSKTKEPRKFLPLSGIRRSKFVFSTQVLPVVNYTDISICIFNF